MNHKNVDYNTKMSIEKEQAALCCYQKSDLKSVFGGSAGSTTLF